VLHETVDVYILAGSVIIIVAVILVTSEGLMKKKSERLEMVGTAAD
jgi:hypothetical protein